MKATFFLIVFTTVFLSARADEITYTNKSATFTNLEGSVFKQVQLVRADLDGLIWRQEASGGRICYTNLAPELLESFGISSNRIEIALARAQHKAVSNARYRALVASEAQAKLAVRRQEQAAWAAGAPAREREAQRQADLDRIKALQTRIEAAQTSLNRTAAAVHDTNMANRHNDYAPTYYVKESARLEIKEAKQLLQRLQSDFTAKYGSEP